MSSETSVHISISDADAREFVLAGPLDTTARLVDFLVKHDEDFDGFFDREDIDGTYCNDHIGGWETWGDIKMIKLSKKFPTILFTVKCEMIFEQHSWKEYYLHGKVQKEYASVEILDFDIAQLGDL